MELNVSNRGLTILPALDPTLISLKCNGNRLTRLPDLPVNLRQLSCGGNLLRSLPELPDSIVVLDCNSNLSLESLPRLPRSLERLSCSGNSIKNLPELPESLRKLKCSMNRLKTLPELPTTLIRLHCFLNQLTTLPKLPENLKDLDCGHNDIITLPKLPEGLTDLRCHDNELTTLPKLPESLERILCVANPFIEPFNTFVEEFTRDNNINKLRQHIDNYYKIKEQGRNVSALMQTIGADELRGTKRWPNINMENFQKSIPADALSEISSYLSGVPRKSYANQQKILHEKATRIPGAPGVGGRRTIKSRCRSRKISKCLRKTRRKMSTVLCQS